MRKGIVMGLASIMLMSYGCSMTSIETKPDGSCKGTASGLFMDVTGDSMSACGASRSTGAVASNTELGSQLIQAGRELIQAGK